MADNRNRFTQTDLDRLSEKMRTPPPLAMHHRPGGEMRALGDVAGRQAVQRQHAEIALRLKRPERRERPAFEPGRETTFTRADLERRR